MGQVLPPRFAVIIQNGNELGIAFLNGFQSTETEWNYGFGTIDGQTVNGTLYNPQDGESFGSFSYTFTEAQGSSEGSTEP